MKKENAKEKTMTTKEVAQALGIDPRSVTRIAKKCLPNKKIVNGKQTLWTESEVTVMLNYEKTENNRTDLTSTARCRGLSTSQSKVFEIQKAYEQMRIASETVQNLLSAYIADLQHQNESLSIELDKSKEYASVKRMDALNPMRMFSWRKLKAKSDEMGIEPKKVFDENYGYVNAYHKSVWESCYELDETPWE